MKSQGPTEPSGLSSLLEKKVGYLEEFLAATESLHHCLENGEAGRTGSFLEKRQSLALSVDAIDQQIERIRSADSGAGGSSGGRLPQPDHPLWKTLERILRKAAEWDQKCLAQTEILCGEIKKEMTSIREGWRATHRYTQRCEVSPRFLDMRK